MNCLACKKELELELSGPEEFYYDCPFCRASLLIKEGECELISEGQALDEPSDSLEEGTDVPEIKEEEDLIEDNLADVQEEAQESVQESVQEEAQESEKEEALKEDTFMSFAGEAPLDAKESSHQEEEVQNEPVGSNEEEALNPEDNFQDEEPAFDSSSEAENEDVNEDTKGTDVPEIKEEEAEPSWQEESADSFQEESAPKEDFSEVVEFAHKEKAKSLFLYDLTLSEINSQEVRDHVLFVLQEEALNLSLQDSQLQDIKKTGKIFLADLSPVQVHVIVHSLMGSPLKIYWKQKHIADS